MGAMYRAGLLAALALLACTPKTSTHLPSADAAPASVDDAATAEAPLPTDLELETFARRRAPALAVFARGENGQPEDGGGDGSRLQTRLPSFAEDTCVRVVFAASSPSALRIEDGAGHVLALVEGSRGPVLLPESGPVCMTRNDVMVLRATLPRKAARYRFLLLKP